jgi:hypothetical protein
MPEIVRKPVGELSSFDTSLTIGRLLPLVKGSRARALRA